MSSANLLLAFANIGPWQIILIVFIVLLLFGAKRLPELFRGMGQGVKEFKKATRDIEDDIRSAVEDEPKKTETSQTEKTKVANEAGAEKKGKEEPKE